MSQDLLKSLRLAACRLRLVPSDWNRPVSTVPIAACVRPAPGVLAAISRRRVEVHQGPAAAGFLGPDPGPDFEGGR